MADIGERSSRVRMGQQGLWLGLLRDQRRAISVG
jgi:hypothetical protein